MRKVSEIEKEFANAQQGLDELRSLIQGLGIMPEVAHKLDVAQQKLEIMKNTSKRLENSQAVIDDTLAKFAQRRQAMATPSPAVDPQNPLAAFTYLPKEQYQALLKKFNASTTAEQKANILKFAQTTNGICRSMQEMASMANMMEEAKKVIISQSKEFYQIGMQYFKKQQYTEALFYFNKALIILNEAPDIVKNASNMEDIITLEYNLGTIHMKMLNYVEALPYLESAYNKRLKLFGANHEKTNKAQEKLQDCKKAVEQDVNVRKHSFRI